MMPLPVTFGVLVLLLMGSAFFSATETALFSLSKIEKRRLAENSPKLAKRVTFHLEHPRRTLVTILIGNLMVNTVAAAMATLLLLKTWGVQSLGIGMGIFTVFFIFVSEILPKVLAVRKSVAIALATAVPLQVMAYLLFPLRQLTRFITDRIVSLIVHEKSEHSDQISAEELKTLVKIGEEEGVLDRQERHMIHKLFQLGERPARVIMTPRTDLVGLDLDDAREKHIEIIRKYHFSNFPVFHHTFDDVLGVVSVQEYVLNPLQDIKTLLKQPLFIPETKRVDDLLEDFRLKSQNFAICVDEYGGTAGIVTLEDILEEIFGEFYDEYAKFENPIRRWGQQEYIVEAKTSLADFNEFFKAHLESQEAATLGGYILEKMGELPQKGSCLELPDFRLKIHDVIKRRIKTVIVERKHD